MIAVTPDTLERYISVGEARRMLGDDALRRALGNRTLKSVAVFEQKIPGQWTPAKIKVSGLWFTRWAVLRILRVGLSATLNRDQRIAIVMARRAEGRTLREIGIEIGLSPERIRQVEWQGRRMAARRAMAERPGAQ